MSLSVVSRSMLCLPVLAGLLFGAVAARAADDIDALPSTVTFVTSTGFWEETADAVEQGQQPRKGYYKLVAVRQPDRTARIYLQQIASTEQGPSVVSSTEIEEFSRLKPFVTDIRPENSAGITTQPGMFATVFLKTDAQAKEPESWTVVIDDLGEMVVEKATN